MYYIYVYTFFNVDFDTFIVTLVSLFVMQSLNQLDRNKIIEDFYILHKGNDKAFTVKHFITMGMERSVVYRVL